MATQQTTTETILPQWYTDYAKNVFGKATAASEMPYQAYGLPRIAGFSPEQEAAFAMAPQKAAAYQPFYASAGELASAGATGSSAAAAAPYLGSAASMMGAGAAGSALGAASPLLGESANMARFAGAGSGAAAANPYFAQSTGMAQQAGAGSSAAAASPYFNPASAYAIQGGSSSALGMASPYFQRGTGSFTDRGVAAQYMNPYTQQVLAGIGDMAGRTLREKLLPEVNRTFVGGGTFGGSRSAEFTARAVRDANAAALSEWTKGMKDAYESAQGQYNTEAGRALAAAGDIGQIAGQDYSRMLDTSGRLASMGEAAGQLTGADYNRLLGASQAISSTGQAAGQLTGADFARMLDASQALSSTGQARGQLAGSDYNRMIEAGQGIAGLGSTAGQLSSSDYARMLSGAGAMQNLGTAAQSAGLQEAQTLEGIGASRQALAQKSADLAYQDFLAQREYPWTQLEKMTNVAGVPSGTGSTSVTKAPGPSTASQLLGTAAGIAGILGSAGVFKDGGKVKRPVKSGLGWLKDRN